MSEQQPDTGWPHDYQIDVVDAELLDQARDVLQQQDQDDDPKP